MNWLDIAIDVDGFIDLINNIHREFLNSLVESTPSMSMLYIEHTNEAFKQRKTKPH